MKEKVESIIFELNRMYIKLDKFQEMEDAQDNNELMYLIGETMGSIDNLTDYLKEQY